MSEKHTNAPRKGFPRAALGTTLAIGLILGTAGLLFSGRERSPRSEWEPSSPGAHEVQRTTDSPAERADLRAAAGAAPGLKERDPSGDASSPPPEVTRATESSGSASYRLTARVTDRQGFPVAGAEVWESSWRWSGETQLVTGDSEGRVDAQLTVETRGGKGPRSQRQLAILAEGHAQQLFDVHPAPGDQIQLGTVALSPGSDVTGFVLDPGGSPVARARVVYYPASEYREESEAADRRRFGLPLTAFTRTDEQGHFRLRSCPRVRGFVVAHPPASHRAGWTQLLEPGVEAPPEVRIVVQPAPPSGEGEPFVRLRVHVSTPDGDPVPQAKVRFWYGDKPRSRWDHGPSPIEIHVRKDHPITVEAGDLRERFAPLQANWAAEEDGELELTLEAAPLLRVVIADPGGTPLSWSHARLRIQDGSSVRSPPLWAFGEDGQEEFRVPEAPFTLECFAPGHCRETFGPFDPARVSSPLLLELRPGGSIAGRVAVAGDALAGARLTFNSTMAPDQWGRSVETLTRRRLFSVRGEVGWDREDAVTDDQGYFQWSVHEDGWYMVCLAAQGVPEQALGPFQLSANAPNQALEITAEEGGALEGFVLASADESAAGRLVAVSAGWDVLDSRTTDADGYYRFDELAPGGYQVREGTAPLASRESIPFRPRDSSVPTPFPSDVRVRPGRTARFDLDLRAPPILVRGRLRIQGCTPAGSIRAGEAIDAHDFAVAPLAHAELAADGSFELLLWRAVAHSIVWIDGDTRMQITANLNEGVNVLDLQRPSGQLLVEWPGAQSARLRLEIEEQAHSPTAPRYRTLLRSEVPGLQDPRVLPIGDYRVRALGSSETYSVSIGEGETTHLELR